MINDIYDIAVIGGGFCGFSCAVKAAWNGKKVLLVEKRPALGWEGVYAGQLDFDETGNSVAQLIKNELSKAGGIKDSRADAPIMEMLLDRILAQSGASLLLYSYPIRLIFDDNNAYGVVIGNKSGEQIIKARVIVDATEEALLWRNTEVKFQRKTPRARQVIFFNHVHGLEKLPIKLRDDVIIYPSVWENEVCVEYKVDNYNLLDARRKMLEVLKYIRDEVPQLKDALLSHSGNEPFPDAPVIQLDTTGGEHKIRNFFGAGIWAWDVKNTPVDRIDLGEKVGHIASRCSGVDKFPSDMTTGSYIRQPEVSSDVMVVGGGTGGAIASIAAGRQGAKTILIEAGFSLGGIGTGGAIHWYCAGTSGGLQDEVDQRISELTPLFAGKWKVKGFHPEVKKLVLQQMAEEANVQIILDTVVTGVIRDSGKAQLKVEENKDQTAIAVSEVKERRNRILGIIAVGSEGVSIYNSKVFIDSTGDGDIAVMAGAPYNIGRDKDNLTHTFSQPAGGLEKDGTLSFMNFDSGYVDPTDVVDLTRGRRLGISHYWQDRFTNETRVLYIAPLIGLRQSRQIVGEYQLTLGDEIAGKRFEDGISFTTTFYDNHGFDYENESDEAALWIWPLGNFNKVIGCEVPYRCLIPKNVDGLILACRAISLTFDAHAGLRMQKDIQRIGEVAGIAASIAAKNNLTPREINIKELQDILKETGVLDEKFRPKQAIPEDKILELPSHGEISQEQSEALVWMSTYRGAENALALKSLLKSDDPNTRFRASTALAWHGIDDGIQELMKNVKERIAEKTKGNKSAPIWQASITFLGIAKDKRAIPVLLDVLRDENATLDGIISAVRALERIGDSSVIPALRELLKRENLPVKRSLQMSMSALKHLKPASEDAKWQIDLAVAETLSRLGASKEEVHQIAEPYLSDERAHVRRYANKVMNI